MENSEGHTIQSKNTFFQHYIYPKSFPTAIKGTLCIWIHLITKTSTLKTRGSFSSTTFIFSFLFYNKRLRSCNSIALDHPLSVSEWNFPEITIVVTIITDDCIFCISSNLTIWLNWSVEMPTSESERYQVVYGSPSSVRFALFRNVYLQLFRNMNHDFNQKSASVSPPVVPPPRICIINPFPISQSG